MVCLWRDKQDGDQNDPRGSLQAPGDELAGRVSPQGLMEAQASRGYRYNRPFLNEAGNKKRKKRYWLAI